MEKPKLIIFASGGKDGGGSGFEKLVEARDSGILNAEIMAVVSNYEHGGVRERANRLGIPFVHFPKPWTKEAYQRIVHEAGAEWVSLSGWLKHVKGLDPRKTINIHPALLSQLDGRFGGEGMYGHHAHEAVKEALDAGEINESGLTMHFVTEEYDRGPILFEITIPLVKSMTADEIGSAVNQVEHVWQPRITDLVIHGEIGWDGKDPDSLFVPYGYLLLPKVA